MSKGFWDSLPKPFFILAPMYDVTDAAFRQIITECGKPHVFFTEFVSTDGLCSEQGRQRLLHHLKFQENEKPIVAQIFGAHPDKFTETAKLIQTMNFDGIDINMGCPDKNITKGGSCAALFKTPKLAKEIILATKEGAGTLPVSVKIRIGDTKIDWENWIGTLLEAEPSAISVHLRTRKEMSKVPAHWEIMPRIVKFIHENTEEDNRPLVIGNGDVVDLVDAKQKITETGCDGVMLGRAIFQNPWLFSSRLTAHSSQSRLSLLLHHAELFEREFTGIKPFEVFKRFIKIYAAGFPESGNLREKLYKANNTQELKEILDKESLF